ncbi:hypothetical protein AURDEDRAFT_172525 [Auricularia subglabra TFB-10046 SS5]|nr:hypothetical protein AURDEDRAFT_172525 [Auricularia subglabra TFB-10046 SS5]
MSFCDDWLPLVTQSALFVALHKGSTPTVPNDIAFHAIVEGLLELVGVYEICRAKYIPPIDVARVRFPGHFRPFVRVMDSISPRRALDDLHARRRASHRLFAHVRPDSDNSACTGPLFSAGVRCATSASPSRPTRTLVVVAPTLSLGFVKYEPALVAVMMATLAAQSPATAPNMVQPTIHIFEEAFTCARPAPERVVTVCMKASAAHIPSCPNRV